DPVSYAKDESDGTFHLDGQLFGGQVSLNDVRVSRQRKKHVQGTVACTRLDLPAVSSAVGLSAATMGIGQAHLSGHLDISELPLDRPFAADLRFDVRELDLDAGAVAVRLLPSAAPKTPGAPAGTPAVVRIDDHAISTSGIALSVKTPGGQNAILDAELAMTEDLNIDAEFKLRETDLGMLTNAVDGIERAEGRLLGHFGAHGKWPAPRLSGALEVHDGKLLPSAIKTPITNLEV